ncbi:MAG: PadR family transcriptional regulator [Thermomicrobiales bacterium]
MLGEEPMHPYRMQRLIEQRGKDRVVNVRERASLYQTIERLLRLGLIAVHATLRGDKHPDRIVYTITDQGRDTAREWLREILRTTGTDYPDFPAGVSVLTLLTPDEVCAQLEIRARAVADALVEIDELLRSVGTLPRLFQLEEEYRRVMLTVELAWLRAVVDDLHTGHLTWNDQWLREVAAAFAPDEGGTAS